MDVLMERDFRKTFDAVADEFRGTFTQLFGGGSARLLLTDPEHLSTSGVDIQARLPGRRPQSLAMLSGGERSLTACALIFALLRVSPTPFCVLDEVDAMLDEANVGRYRDMLLSLMDSTQFIIVTHNRNTVQVADTVYGITMGADSASQVMGLKLEGEKLKTAETPAAEAATAHLQITCFHSKSKERHPIGQRSFFVSESVPNSVPASLARPQSSYHIFAAAASRLAASHFPGRSASPARLSPAWRSAPTQSTGAVRARSPG